VARLGGIKDGPKTLDFVWLRDAGQARGWSTPLGSDA
jgi:hypothetical protein